MAGLPANFKFKQKTRYTTVMDMMICPYSALDHWRLHGNAKIEASARQRRKNLPEKFPGITAILDSTPVGLPYPIDLMVISTNAKWRSKVIRPHVYTGNVPEWGFISLGPGVYVSSPSFCFFQMAGELPLVKLIELGLELCGTYSLPVNNGETLYGHPRLTNVNSLKAFTIQMKGIKGQSKATRALRFIANGSASPMETKLFMLLTLKYVFGGYGLLAPKLNKRVDPRKAAKQMENKKYFVCDLFWPQANLAVEYDSDANHTGSDRINDDSKKRTALESAGIKVITVTNEQIQNADELDIVAQEIAKRLGKQLRINDPKFKKAQRELRRQLGLQ